MAKATGTLSKLLPIIKTKGDFLYVQNGQLWLMEEGRSKKAHLLELSSNKPFEPLKVSKQYIYVISINPMNNNCLKDISKSISECLKYLIARGATYRISRPLPRHSISQDFLSEMSVHKVPTTCRDCLELYTLEKNGTARLCNGSKIKFLFTKNGRQQLYEYLKSVYGEIRLSMNENPANTLTILNHLNCYHKSEKRNSELKLDFASYWISKVGWKPNPYPLMIINELSLSNVLILDNGGAHGKDSFALSTRGYRPILLDKNWNLLRACLMMQKNKKILFPITQADSLHLPLKDSSFDCVYSGGVIHHEMTLKCALEYIREAYRVIKPNGYFFGQLFAYWDLNYFPKKYLLQIKDDSMFIGILERAGFVLLQEIHHEVLQDEPHKHILSFICHKKQRLT